MSSSAKPPVSNVIRFVPRSERRGAAGIPVPASREAVRPPMTDWSSASYHEAAIRDAAPVRGA